MVRYTYIKLLTLLLALVILVCVLYKKNCADKGLVNKRVVEVISIVDQLLKEIIDMKVGVSSNELSENVLLDDKYEQLQTIKSFLQSLILPKIKQDLKTEEVVILKQSSSSSVENKKGFKLSSSSETTSTTTYSCPESYKGSLYGYPRYRTGFVRRNCTKVPTDKSVTLILVDPYGQSQDLFNLSNKARKTCFDLYIVYDEKIARDYSKELLSRFKVFAYGENITLGSLLNQIIRSISTPFVLLAPYLANWDESTHAIERLLDAHQLLNVSVVSAASRDVASRVWNRGCYQTSLRFYVMKITQGYMKSKQECLFCDYTNNPFLSPTKLLKEIGFNAILNKAAFLDFFIQLKLIKKHTVVCPDVMFEKQNRKFDRHELRLFAELHDVKKIEVDENTYWFGCRRRFNHTSNFKCVHKKGMAVPPCCIENLKDAISYLFSLCIERNISCVLQEGSVLGAVKFHGILPWERDVDIAIPSKDFNTFLNLSAALLKNNYELVVDELPECCDINNNTHGGVTHIRADGWSMQVYGHSTDDSNDSLTKFKIREQLINLPKNPGLYVRNRYGDEVYKHAEHWMTTGKTSSWEDYKSGHFEVCSIPGHHACLDQLEADGDNMFSYL